MFGLKSEQAVIDLTNRLCKKGWAARIPFRYSDSGKLGRNLVILDKGLADYQQFIRAIKLKLEAKVDKSRAPNGGNANKYLQQLLPFVDDANLTTSAMRVKADNILDNKLTSAHKIQELPGHQEDYEQDLDNPW
ncbi:hypothetical protein [Litorilituus sediminis]|nr:hypothetical protein [Litorilituus sediminis]